MALGARWDLRFSIDSSTSLNSSPRRNEPQHYTVLSTTALIHIHWIQKTGEYIQHCPIYASSSSWTNWLNKQTIKNIFCLWLCLEKNSKESTSKLYRHENFLLRLYNSQAPWLVAVWIPNSEIKTMHRLINSICYFFLNPSENDLLWSASRDKLPRGYSNFCSNTFSQLRPSSHTHPWDSGLAFVICLFTTCRLIPLINSVDRNCTFSPRRKTISNPALITDEKLMTTEEFSAQHQGNNPLMHHSLQQHRLDL